MNFNFIVLAIASLSHLTISFLSLSKQKNRISISFSLLSFCLSLWTILYAITYWVGDSGATLFFTRILTIPSFFYPSIFLYLTNVFPEDEDRFRCFFYIYHISFIAYFLFHFNSNDYINSAKMIDNNINFNAGYIYFILGVYILTTMFYGCILLFRKLKFLSVIGRKQVGFVIAGALISIIFGGIFGILLPSYGVSDYNFFAPAGTIFVILFWYYAITKHELMDIKLVITRIGSYVAVIGFLTFMLFMTQFSDLPLLIKTLLLTVIAIFFAIFGDKFREKIQTSAVRKWVSDWYNSDQLISRVLEKLVAVLNREDVFNVIAKEIYDTIKVEKVLTFLAIREAKTDEIISYSFPQKNATYGLSDPLILFALQQKEPLLFMLKDSVIADDIAQFNLRRSVALVPFWIKDELDAFLLVDQKSSEVAYIEKDKIVFRMLSIQGSMALDRIRPFEENLKKLYDTERQLAISEKIASLGHLIQEYNHEIRTPLTVIKCRLTDIISGQTETPAKIKEDCKVMMTKADRISDIVTTTLRLQGSQKRHEKDLNLNDVIQQALDVLPPSGVIVELALAEIPFLLGVLDDLQIVFTNLIKNACEAMSNGGQLTISTEVQTEGLDTFVCATIKDTGIGISKNNLERIFEPFFSTHVTEGRGLGLSIVFRIVREHLGHINVQSTLGQGTIFFLKFKKRESPASVG